MTATTQLDPTLFYDEPEPRAVVALHRDRGGRPLVEPPDTFEGRLPAALADQAPRIVETPRGTRSGSSRATRYTQVGMNAVAGRRPETVRPRAVPLRPDAAGLLRHRRPRARHGHQRRLGLGELPVHDHRILRAGLLRRQGPRAGPGLRRGPGTTGSSRSGTRATPSASSRSASPIWPTPELRWPRSGATPTAASPRSPSPSARTRSGCPSLWDRAHWDPIMEAVVETDTVVSPPRRVARAWTRRRRARGCAWQLGATLFGQLSLTACAEWLWSGYAVPLPGLQDRHERGRHRLGGHAARPPRQHRRPLRLRPGLGRCVRPTSCSATSGSAPSTTRRPSTPATASGSTTSWSRSTTPMATAPGPTPRTSSSGTGAIFPSRRAAGHVLRERRRVSTATPCPTSCCLAREERPCSRRPPRS